MRVERLTVELTLDALLSLISDELGLDFDVDMVVIDTDIVDYNATSITLPLVIDQP